MAGGEVHVSFVASSKHCTINFNTYKYALSNFPFMSSLTFENPNAKIS